MKKYLSFIKPIFIVVFLFLFFYFMCNILSEEKKDVILRSLLVTGYVTLLIFKAHKKDIMQPVEENFKRARRLILINQVLYKSITSTAYEIALENDFSSEHSLIMTNHIHRAVVSFCNNINELQTLIYELEPYRENSPNILYRLKDVNSIIERYLELKDFYLFDILKEYGEDPSSIDVKKYLSSIGCVLEDFHHYQRDYNQLHL